MSFIDELVASQKAENEKLKELLKELAHAPVHVDEYALQEISCIFCTPFEDEKGRVHHAPTCLVERAKAALEGKL